MKGGACKNKANLETRENKVTATVRQINTTASTDLIRGVETRVILILYEKSAIPSLINNCESWTLSPAEESQVDKIGIIGYSISLQQHLMQQSSSVSASSMYLHMYLQKLLTRDGNHWTNKTGPKHLWKIYQIITWDKLGHNKSKNKETMEKMCRECSGKFQQRKTTKQLHQNNHLWHQHQNQNKTCPSTNIVLNLQETTHKRHSTRKETKSPNHNSVAVWYVGMRNQLQRNYVWKLQCMWSDWQWKPSPK